MLQTVLVAVQPHIVELVSVGVAIFVSNATVYAKRKWKIDVEARHREALQSALTNGAMLALSRGYTGKIAADAVIDYVLDSVPDAVKNLKPTDKRLHDLALAKLKAASK
jgi:hypothetical protein